MSEGYDGELCGEEGDALEPFSFTEERGKEDPEDGERRELTGDNPPLITGEAVQDGLGVSLCAPT